MKGYLAKKHVTYLKTLAQMDSSAILVQKLLRSILAKNRVENIRIEIGAAIMI